VKAQNYPSCRRCFLSEALRTTLRKACCAPYGGSDPLPRRSTILVRVRPAPVSQHQPRDEPPPRRQGRPPGGLIERLDGRSSIDRPSPAEPHPTKPGSTVATSDRERRSTVRPGFRDNRSPALPPRSASSAPGPDGAGRRASRAPHNRGNLNPGRRVVASALHPADNTVHARGSKSARQGGA
jgi:hypothetical protein